MNSFRVWFLLALVRWRRLFTFCGSSYRVEKLWTEDSLGWHSILLGHWTRQKGSNILQMYNSPRRHGRCAQNNVSSFTACHRIIRGGRGKKASKGMQSYGCMHRNRTCITFCSIFPKNIFSISRQRVPLQIKCWDKLRVAEDEKRFCFFRGRGTSIRTAEWEHSQHDF
jgi:hypothetical protein